MKKLSILLLLFFIAGIATSCDRKCTWKDGDLEYCYDTEGNYTIDGVINTGGNKDFENVNSGIALSIACSVVEGNETAGLCK
jgi:hypothetical protein